MSISELQAKKKTPLGHRGVTVAGNRMMPDGLTRKMSGPAKLQGGSGIGWLEG